MLQAVIFDWDEVVVKSDSFNEYALGEALSLRALPFDHGLYRKYFFGRTLKEGLRDYLVGMTEPMQFLEELMTAKKTFDSEYERLITPHDDAIDLIARLRGRYKLAIASGTRRILSDAGLRKLGLLDVFDVIVTSEDYNNGKPAPDAFLVTLERLNKICGLVIQPQNVLVIEDSPLGVRAAKVAQMMCVAVTHTHATDQLVEADLVVNDLRDVNVAKWDIK